MRCPTHDEVVERLMADYDRRYFEPSPFTRGLVEYEYRKALDALAALGLAVVEEVE